jgi:hypothetical protein
MYIHHRAQVTVEIVQGDIDIRRISDVGDFGGLPDAIPDGIDDRHVHRLLLEKRQKLARPKQCFAGSDWMAHALSDRRHRLSTGDVEFHPEQVEFLKGEKT